MGDAPVHHLPAWGAVLLAELWDSLQDAQEEHLGIVQDLLWDV